MAKKSDDTLHEGVYDELLTEKHPPDDSDEAHVLVEPFRKLSDSRATAYLSAYLRSFNEQVLSFLASRPDERWNFIQEQLALGRTFMQRIIPHAPRLPLGVLRQLRHRQTAFGDQAISRPHNDVSRGYLSANHKDDLQLHDILAREFPSADRVDIIMAFIKKGGVSMLAAPIREAVDRGVPVRLITSAYFRSTEADAVELLHNYGVEIRMNMDPNSSSLHTKAWLFERKSGYSTAIVGSSNLTPRALTDGQEWNIRVTERETPQVVQSFRDYFKLAWDSGEFVPYSTETHRERLIEALSTERFNEDIHVLGRPLTPRSHQQEALDALERERRHYGHHENLLVSATGSGKTVTAAFDYARFISESRRPRLLYIAHQRQILSQALRVFRRVLNDQHFGELFVGDSTPEVGHHVFAGIQMLTQRGVLDTWSPDSFDFIIIDEFHHAVAPSYRRILEHFQPRELLGLTATPDRLDGQDIRAYFDGRVAYELPLIEALDAHMLAPFHYFGVNDETDLRQVRWSRNAYDAEALASVLIGNDHRLHTILNALHQYVDDVAHMRALGFCVTVQHAHDMARQFSEQGLPSVALHAKSSQEERDATIQRLQNGELRCIFTVDLFNEGIDIPEVDTLLFLRPTQSSTIFQQQLGRGLRLSKNKEQCVVLDFIGQHRHEYRFENVFSVFAENEENAAYAIRHNFPNLPSGSLIYLEPQARQKILANIDRSRRHQYLVFDQNAAPLRLESILKDSEEPVEQLYRSAQLRHGLFAHQRERWAHGGYNVPAEWRLPEGLSHASTLRPGNLSHLDDDIRLNGLLNIAKGRADANPSLLTNMLLARLSASRSPADLAACLAYLPHDKLLQRELEDLASWLRAHRRRPLAQLTHGGETLFSIHGRYTRTEILAGLTPPTADNGIRTLREGVYYHSQMNTDIFFVTIHKDDGNFSESTRYEDYPKSPSRFVWQTQNRTTTTTPTGKRYIENSSRKLLFVRDHGKISNITQPFYFLGPVHSAAWEGEAPVTIELELEYPMTREIFRALRLFRN